MYGSRDDKDRKIEYLEREIDDYREQQERERERERRAEEARHEEWRQRAEERMRTADNWPEALGKQIGLMGREAREEITFNREREADGETITESDTYFQDGKAACERALAIWQEVEAEKADEIRELYARIQAIEDGVKGTVADRLEAENTRPGWQSIANSLRNEDPESFLNW